MRKTLMLVGIPVGVLGVAIAIVAVKHGSATKPNDQFTQDLQLAQNQAAATTYALTEVAPQAKPQPAKSIKQGNGPKAIRSKAPTVKAAPEPVNAQSVDQTQVTQVTENAPAPTPTEVIAPVPQAPQPDISQGPILAGGSGRSTGSSNGGIGIGSILGSILRGGVGDGDNCDPRPAGRGSRGGQRSGPIYRPNPHGMSDVRNAPRQALPTPVGIIGGIVLSRARGR